MHGRLLHLLVKEAGQREEERGASGREREYRYACVVLEGEKAAQEGKQRERERERAGQHRQDEVEAAIHR